VQPHRGGCGKKRLHPLGKKPSTMPLRTSPEPPVANVGGAFGVDDRTAVGAAITVSLLLGQ